MLPDKFDHLLEELEQRLVLADTAANHHAGVVLPGQRLDDRCLDDRCLGILVGCHQAQVGLDTTLVTQPTSALWFADAGWAVDNHGVDPDVEVTIAPHDWAAGRDPQLDTAVRLALRALEQHTPAAPPTY
jgi:hypothetical protein